MVGRLSTAYGCGNADRIDACGNFFKTIPRRLEQVFARSFPVERVDCYEFGCNVLQGVKPRVDIFVAGIVDAAALPTRLS